MEGIWVASVEHAARDSWVVVVCGWHAVGCGADGGIGKEKGGRRREKTRTEGSLECG